MMKEKKAIMLVVFLVSLYSGQALAQTDETPPPGEVSEPAGEADEALPPAVEKRMAEQEAKFQAQLDALEKKYDAQFKVVFEAIRQLMKAPESKRRRIGFKAEGK